jgi:hypothetical protein
MSVRSMSPQEEEKANRQHRRIECRTFVATTRNWRLRALELRHLAWKARLKIRSAHHGTRHAPS